jgi:uncharacterized protein YdhG (YjbR/CyaY superfamily)
MVRDPISDYIQQYPAEVQQVLNRIRDTIRKSAPAAQEAIKYQIPTFVMSGKNLVHFAAFKNHIGFYPSPQAIEDFKAEFAAYQTSKGAVQFPLGSKIPYSLIRRVVQARVRELSPRKKTTPRKK